MPLTRGVLPALLAGVLGLFPGVLPVDMTAGSASAEATETDLTVETDLGGALDMARRALKSGRPDLAVMIARQILVVYPEDAATHMILAAGLTRVGKPEEAAPVARAGFRLATVPEARFEGAYLAAEAFAASGRVGAAKFWLRKADRYATSDEGKAVLRKAYRNVAAKSPVSLSFSVFAGPSENVNGGSLHDRFVFQNVAIPIEQALPGWIAGGSLNLRYSLPKSMVAELSWTHKSVFLGARAEAIHPNARASEMAQDAVAATLAKNWTGSDGKTFFRVTGAVGRRWTGGQVSANLTRLDFLAFRDTGTGLILGGRIGVENLENPKRPTSDSLTYSAGLTLRHVSARFGGTVIDLGFKDVQSDAAGIAWRGPALSLGWEPALKSETFSLALNASAERRDYWRSPSIGPDVRIGLSATVEFKKLDFMGFNPTLTVQAERTHSDVVVRDTADFGLNFGISSSF